MNGIEIPASSIFTPREEQVLRALECDLTNKEIAQSLHLSATTIAGYITNIFNKLGVHCRMEAISKVRKLMPEIIAVREIRCEIIKHSGNRCGLDGKQYILSDRIYPIVVSLCTKHKEKIESVKGRLIEYIPPKIQ